MNWYWSKGRFFNVDLIASVLLAVAMIFCSEFGYIGKLSFSRDIIIAAAGLAGSLLGFMIAALAVMLALLDEDGVKLLQGSAHIKTILFAYNSTLVYLGVLTLGLLLTPIVEPETITNPYFAGEVLGLLLICSLRIQKSVWFLIKILNILRK